VSVPEFRSTVRLLKMRFDAGKVAEKDWNLKKNSGTRVRRVRKESKNHCKWRVDMGTKENFTLGARFLAFESGI
jgi:hypothetical protein